MVANIPKDRRRDAKSNGEKPGQDNYNWGLLNRTLILGPNRKHDGNTAVHADDDKEVDAAEHVEEHNRRGELAHEAAEDPLVHHCVGDAYWEESAEDKVRDGQAQVPGGVDRLLHFEARDPDDQSIPKEAQQKND